MGCNNSKAKDPSKSKGKKNDKSKTKKNNKNQKGADRKSADVKAPNAILDALKERTAKSCLDKYNEVRKHPSQKIKGIEGLAHEFGIGVKEPSDDWVKARGISEEDLPSIEARLYYTAMAFDFDLGGEVEEPIEERFARQTTNDNAEIFMAEVGYIVFAELRKFLFLVARYILHKKINNDFSEDEFMKDMNLGSWVYKTPYYPSYQVDRAWRFLIGEGLPYYEYCYALTGGVIDRYNICNPNNVANLFPKYTLLREALTEHKEYLQPYWGIWPDFPEEDGYLRDFKYNITVAPSKRRAIYEWLDQRTDSEQAKNEDRTQDTVTLEFVEGVVEECRNENLKGEISDPVEDVVPDTCPEVDFINAEDAIEVQALVGAITSYDLFPPNMKIVIQSELMVTEELATKWMEEYKKYWVIAFIANKPVAPPRSLENVWRIHQTYTWHYRTMLHDVFNSTDIATAPSYQNTEASLTELTNHYNTAREIYKIVYGHGPPVDTWGSVQNRCKEDNAYNNSMNIYTTCLIQTYLDVYNEGLGYEETLKRADGAAADLENADLVNALRQHRGGKEGGKYKEKLGKIKGVRNKRHHAKINVAGIKFEAEAPPLEEGAEAPAPEEEEGEFLDPNEDDMAAELQVQAEEGEEEDYVDPVLNYGGLKFIGRDDDEEYVNSPDLGDKIDAGIYEALYYEDANEERDLIEVVEVAYGILDIMDDNDIDADAKGDLGVPEGWRDADVVLQELWFDEFEAPNEGADAAFNSGKGGA